VRSPEGIIFITAGERSVACGGYQTPIRCLQRQNFYSILFCPLRGRGFVLRTTAGNAALACGYENPAFQATRYARFIVGIGIVTSNSYFGG
jgi:hypothetical protein